jgi:aminopeptidase N
MPIRKPTEIDEIFDDITYEKGIKLIFIWGKKTTTTTIFLGSSVIRLLHAFIGNTAFRLGLSNYLAEYAYKNTITDNLWLHLSRTSNRSDLSDILSTWTKQMGYPLLTVWIFFFFINLLNFVLN